MKSIKKYILFFLLIIIFIIVIMAIRKFMLYSNNELVMVQKYLNDKYNMNLKIKDYDYYANGSIGINSGKHYTFKFEKIDGFALNAKLDYVELNKNNLDLIVLNITNVKKAKELRNYLREKGLNYKITDYRIIENSNEGNYYYINIESNYNSDYSVSLHLAEGQSFKNAYYVNVSSSLKEKYNLEENNNIDFLDLLDKINYDL